MQHSTWSHRSTWFHSGGISGLDFHLCPFPPLPWVPRFQPFYQIMASFVETYMEGGVGVSPLSCLWCCSRSPQLQPDLEMVILQYQSHKSISSTPNFISKASSCHMLSYNHARTIDTSAPNPPTHPQHPGGLLEDRDRVIKQVVMPDKSSPFCGHCLMAKVCLGSMSTTNSLFAILLYFPQY